MSTIEKIEHGYFTELRLNNPSKLNAFTPNMLSTLAQYCDEIDYDTRTQAVLITAEPARAFCAGADINAWADLEPQVFAREWVRSGHRIFDRLARLSKPTIAVVTGPALGGGLEYISACDIRVMNKSAHIALPEASIGVVPGWSGSQRLARLLPEAVLKEMILFGRHIGAERAYALGYVAEISDDPLAAALQIMEDSSRLSRKSVEVSKYMIHAGVGEDSAAMIDALGGGMVASSSEKTEGVNAFRAKRTPNFSGKAK